MRPRVADLSQANSQPLALNESVSQTCSPIGKTVENRLSQDSTFEGQDQLSEEY